ncbi:hypothetical protein ACJJTC_017066 [Scirpophaga incertulas]
MNIPNSLGESSSRQQENGDASGPERPFKKARFAWQVKGKYHLKNETNNSPRPIPVPKNKSDGAGSSCSSTNTSNSFVGNTEQNLEILGDYLLKQDFNTLDSVITDTDKSLLTSSTKLSTETVEYPRYVSSYENNNSADSIIENYENENFSIPLSMVVSNSCSEDQCIARWQAKQMAKGFVDNTINRVLDSWTQHPLPSSMYNSRFLALDVAEFINNLPGADSIENEGILMAISAHGLQNTSGASGNSPAPIEAKNTYINEETFLSPPSSPDDSDDEILHLESSHKKNSEIISSDLEWTYADDNMKKESAMSQFSFFPENTNTCQYFDTNDHIETGVDYDADDNSSCTHFDFMDTAVSFAIQNKGLTAFGTDYG